MLMKHPWQNGPAELINCAFKNLKSDDDFQRRLSFILFDMGIELLFKTFLLLPEDITGVKINFSERQKYASGNFHSLINGIRASTKIINDVDLRHIEFYHDIRNHLYHQGNGITVSKENLEGYADISAKVSKTLLDIDLNERLKPRSSQDQKNIVDLYSSFENLVFEFKTLTNSIVEKLEPRLVYPSVVKSLEILAEKIEISSFPDKIENFRKLINLNITNPDIKNWLLDLVPDDIYFMGTQAIANTNFILELVNDPIKFYLLILGTFYFPVNDFIKEDINNYDDISFIEIDDYHLLGIYNSSLFLLDYINRSKEYAFDDDFLFKRAKELQQKLKNMENEMNAFLLKNNSV